MLKVGDRVQITGGKAGMVPKSLVGCSARVVKLNLKTVKIRLEGNGRELNIDYQAVLLME